MQVAPQIAALTDRGWTSQRCRIVLEFKGNWDLFIILSEWTNTSDPLDGPQTTCRYKCCAVYQPASFEVMVSSYSSRTFSSLSLSRRSQIIPTCLRVNNGCSFLLGETPPEDAPVHKRNTKGTMISLSCKVAMTIVLGCSFEDSVRNQPDMLEICILDDWDGDSGE